MKTRKQHNQQEKEVVVQNPAVLKLKINKFINPMSVFRISNNLFIQEQYFGSNKTKCIPHESFFKFNKIVRGKVEGDLIKFTLIPVVNEYQTDYNYLIRRFQSFGDQKFKVLADLLSRIQHLRKRVPEVQDDFFNLEHVIKKFNTKKPLFIMNDIPQKSNSLQNAHKQIYVSQSFMNKNGFQNPQQYILQCIRKGDLCFSFLVALNDGNIYIDRIISKVQSIVSAIEGAMQIKTSRQTEPQSCSRSQPEDLMQARVLQVRQVHQSFNVNVKYEFVQTPFLYCSQIIQSTIQPIPANQLNRKNKDLVDEQQYDLLQKLIPISHNKLKRFQDKVCNFRQLPRSLAFQKQ